MTCSIWKVWANRLSFAAIRCRGRAFEDQHANGSQTRGHATSNHHPERSASRHAGINAAMTQPSTRTVATLVTTSPLPSGSRPSAKQSPAGLTSKQNHPQCRDLPLPYRLRI